jgi:hypothetical protein
MAELSAKIILSSVYELINYAKLNIYLSPIPDVEAFYL